MKAAHTAALLALVAGSAFATQSPHDESNGVLVLNPNAAGAATVSGQARVLSKHFHVASNNNEAISVNGQGRIECSEICIAGGYELNGGQAQLMGAVWTGFAVGDDPFEARINQLNLDQFANGESDENDNGALKLSGGEHIVQPGYYSGGIQITGAKVHLMPGTYVLHGGVSIASHSVISGDGVTIVVLSGGLSVSGQAKFSIDAPEEGEYADLSIVMPSAQSGDIDLTGGSELSIEGVIYAPGSHTSITGHATASSHGPFVGELVITDTLSLAGRGLITIGAIGNINLITDPKRD